MSASHDKRWDKAIRRAERDLRRNAARIEATPRGTPASKRSSWKLGASPSQLPEVRR